MELELTFWDALNLLNIESEEEARDYDGLCIQPDGITLIVESYRDVLTPGEMANLLRQYPHAERGKPVLTFPVAWPDFKKFIETCSLVGYVDAVKAVDWVLARPQPGADQEAKPEGKQSTSARRAHARDNDNALVGLLVLALTKRVPAYLHQWGGRQTLNVSTIKDDLEAIMKASEIDGSGLSLPERLGDGWKAIEERRLGNQ